MPVYEEVPWRINVFAGQVYSACGMRGWCFDNQRNFIFTTSTHQQELLNILRISGCLDYAYDHFAGQKLPFILSDSMGLMWLGEFFHQVEQNSLLFLFGPVFLSHASVKGIEASLSGMNLSVAVRSGLVRILQQIPVVPLAMLQQYALMMHFTITEETIRTGDILFQPARINNSGSRESVDLNKLEYYNIEEVRTVEQMLLQFVRDGNTNYRKVWEQIVGPLPQDNFQTGVPMREVKDTLLIFTALCSRAAIEGGLAPKTAKSMENHYISQLEKAETATELTLIQNAMMDDFTARVNQGKQNPQISQTVHQCFDYVKNNLLQDFSLADIARAVGYTEYYLTKKFQKETGIRLIDYIKDMRIDHAKIWLMSTSKSIQEISDQMHFGTRFYFSKVFRERVGMTPAAFRNKMRTAASGQTGRQGNDENDETES
ncbi:MAG TPA: hypothetical protein DCM45_01680 [Clostridiales bacterium]|nr:hypothetical protein [Clostridiales bacterium]